MPPVTKPSLHQMQAHPDAPMATLVLGPDPPPKTRVSAHPPHPVLAVVLFFKSPALQGKARAVRVLCERRPSRFRLPRRTLPRAHVGVPAVRAANLAKASEWTLSGWWSTEYKVTVGWSTAVLALTLWLAQGPLHVGPGARQTDARSTCKRSRQAAVKSGSAASPHAPGATHRPVARTVKPAKPSHVSTTSARTHGAAS